MIWFYSGTPGSGKSLDVTRRLIMQLRFGRPVISTNDLDLTIVQGKRKKIGRFTYVPIMELTPQFLVEYAVKHNKPGKESQVLVIVDECQIIFNPREFSKKGRLDWINFFTQHRKFGYDFILVSQFDRLIDRQIRSLFEYEVKHRKANNFKWLWILPFTFFVKVTVWYGMREKISSEFFVYKKIYSKIYDSFALSSTTWEDSTAISKWGITTATDSTAEAGTEGPPPSREEPAPVIETDFDDELAADQSAAVVPARKSFWKKVWEILKSPRRSPELAGDPELEGES
jgi:zona occludens toxin (predicted ATPase)